MLFASPRYILLTHEHEVELWQRRGRTVQRYASLSDRMDNFPAALGKLLEVTRNHRLILLLNLPDLQLVQEAAPKVGWMDRRKIIRQRLSYHYPQHDISISWRKGDQVSMAGLRPTPWLKTITQALSRSRCKLVGTHHMAIEAMRLIRKDQLSDGLVLLRLPKNTLLLAYSRNELKLIRLLENDQQLQHDLARTRHYMQRHGWNDSQPIRLTAYNTALPTDFNRSPFQIIHKLEDGLTSVLTNLFIRRGHVHLRSRLLYRKKQHQNLVQWLKRASLFVLVANAFLWTISYNKLEKLDRENAALQAELQTLPAAMVVNDEKLLDILSGGVATRTIQQLESLPLQNSNLSLPTPMQPTAALRLTTIPLHNTEIIADSLPSWTAEGRPARNSGSLGDDDEPQVFSLAFTRQP